MPDLFSASETSITALQNEEDIIVLQAKEIYMVSKRQRDRMIIFTPPHRNLFRLFRSERRAIL